MPLIRCNSCDLPYDVPPAIAVRMATSIARCSCGKLLYGDHSTLINRALGDGDLPEIDMSQYQTDEKAIVPPLPTEESPFPDETEATPIHIQVVVRGSGSSITETFTIADHPLYIGRMGCHVQIEDAELSIRHCSLERRGDQLVLSDMGSHTGTFVDGEQILERVLDEGVHLIRVGGALVSVERVGTPGTQVVPIELATEQMLAASPLLMKKLLERGAKAAKEAVDSRTVLVGVDGPCKGMEFEIPPEGAIVGRKGTVKVPDEYLSRKHFAFVRDEEDGTLRIRDLGSSNGTFLNTLPARDTRVEAGDEIRAGYSVFRIELRR